MRTRTMLTLALFHVVCGGIVACGGRSALWVGDGETKYTGAGGFGGGQGGSAGAGGGCGPGLSSCEGACVDLKNDPSHCGACDNVCTLGASCIAGVCVTECAYPMTFLGLPQPIFPTSFGPMLESDSLTLSGGSIVDLNGDNLPDLLTLQDGLLFVSLGHGDGTFEPPVQASVEPLPIYPKGLALADLDGNGTLDFASTNGDGSDPASSSVTVLLGQGDGTFATGASYTGSNLWGIGAGDFDGDGVLDLLTHTLPSYAPKVDIELVLLHGHGDGTFDAPTLFPADSDACWGLRIFDANGDGLADLACASFALNKVAMLMNQGGALGPPDLYDMPSAGGILRIADLDANGSQDIVAASGAGFEVLLNQGNGKFEAMPHHPLGYTPFSFSAGDMNGDGKLDLVTHPEGYKLSVLVNAGDGTFLPAVDYGPAAYVDGTALVDLTGDGLAEVIVNAHNTTPGVLLNRGGGILSVATTYASGSKPITLLVGEVDGDGHPDLIFTAGTQLGILRNAGNGTFSAPTFYDSPAEGFVREPALLEFDGDGHLDVITKVVGGPSDFILWRNQGDGTFSSEVGIDLPSFPGEFVLVDLNGDGLTDLVGNNSVRLNQGGSFAPPIQYKGTDEPHMMAGADINGDKIVDLITMSGSLSLIRVFIGHGDGTFLSSIDTPTDESVGSIMTGELNGDGALDLAGPTDGYGDSPGCIVWLNHGDGSFAPAKRYAISCDQLGDLNQDGLLDLLHSREDEPIELQLNQGDGTFAPIVHYRPGWNPSQPVFHDLDGDGRLDAADIGDGVVVALNACLPW